jgi:hypothetical protein
MDAVNANNPDLWKALGAIFGPGGVALLLALGASLYFNRMQWHRLKEKDDECRTEREKAREYTRADTKEAFGQVAELTKQVTQLVERVGSLMNARTRGE